MKLSHDSKGFTLIELIITIVILGILAVVAVPKYMNMQANATTATAKGILAALRGANSTLFASDVLNNTTTAYTMGDIVNAAIIQGLDTTPTTAANAATFVISGSTFTFSLTSPTLPTTPGIVYAATSTW